MAPRCKIHDHRKFFALCKIAQVDLFVGPDVFVSPIFIVDLFLDNGRLLVLAKYKNKGKKYDDKCKKRSHFENLSLQKTIFSDADYQDKSWQYVSHREHRGHREIPFLCILSVSSVLSVANLLFYDKIMSDKPTVSDIFRRALEMRKANPNASYKDVASQIVSEFSGKGFPSTDKLTIPEYDNITPEEDWTAGLPVVLRGIQNEDWNDIAQGIIISLEQVENYPKESGREDDPAKEWRNRTKGIGEAEEKVLEKWMPADLMTMAKQNTSQNRER